MLGNALVNFGLSDDRLRLQDVYVSANPVAQGVANSTLPVYKWTTEFLIDEACTDMTA